MRAYDIKLKKNPYEQGRGNLISRHPVRKTEFLFHVFMKFYITFHSLNCQFIISQLKKIDQVVNIIQKKALVTLVKSYRYYVF